MISSDIRERQNKALSELYQAVCRAQSADLEYDRSPKAFPDDNQRLMAMTNAMSACKAFCDSMALRDDPQTVGNVIAKVYGMSRATDEPTGEPERGSTAWAMQLMNPGRAGAALHTLSVSGDRDGMQCMSRAQTAGESQETRDAQARMLARAQGKPVEMLVSGNVF